MSWEIIEKPKKDGGLGVGNLAVKNSALLFKWWWHFSKEECPLWKKVVCSCNDIHMEKPLFQQQIKQNGGIWAGICSVNFDDNELLESMNQGIRLELGNRTKTRFWWDRLLDGGILKDMFPRLFSLSNQKECCVRECGFWDGLQWIWNF